MSSSSSGYSGSPGPAGLGAPGHMSTLGHQQQQHHQQQQQSHILPGSLNVVAVAGLGNPHPSGTNAFLPSTMVLPSEVSNNNNSASGLTGGCGASRNIISSPIQVGSGPSKGLLNGPGQNNCFLNCAVQVSPTCIN